MWVEKILQTKKPEKIHLENLIKEKRIEDASVEYKRLDVITNNDKESLISSVIGLAHGQGGLLILGMDDDKLLPKELIWGDAQVYTKERLESILRDNIDPMISLTIHQVINQNKIVFVLDIPRSDHIHFFKGFFIEINLLELGSISIILAKKYLELVVRFQINVTIESFMLCQIPSCRSI